MATPENEKWMGGSVYPHTSTLDISNGDYDPSIKYITIHRTNNRPINLSITWQDNSTEKGRLFPTTLGSNDDIFSLFPNEEIISVKVFEANDSTSIEGFQFETSANRESPRFGNITSKPTILSGYLSNENDAPPIKKAKVLKAIQLGHNSDSTKLIGIKFLWRNSAVLDAPNIWVGDRAGPGPDGFYQWPDFLGFGNPLNKRLIKVAVWATNSSGVAFHAIQCTWEDTTKPGSIIVGTRNGPKTDKGVILDLLSGEQVVSLYVRYSTFIGMIFATVKKADGTFYEKHLGGLVNEQYGVRSPVIMEPPLPNMSLLGFRAFGTNFNDRPAAFEPIWVANPPTGYEIVIDRIVWDQSRMTTSTGRPSSTSAGVSTNATSDPIITTIAYEYTTTKSSRFQLDSSITTTFGVEVSSEVSVSASSGFVSGTATAGFSAFSEISGTFSTSEELAKEETVSHTFSEEVTIPPRKQLEHNAVFRKVECRGLEWKGRVFVRYVDGARHEAGDVGGTFSGTDNSVLLTSYTLSDAGATLPEPVYAEFP